MSQWIPQAKDFAKRFKWTIIGSIALLFVSIVFLINYSSIIHDAPQSQENTDSSQAAASIKNLGAQDVPIILLDNWAVIIDGKKYSIYQHGDEKFFQIDGKNIPLEAGQKVSKDGQEYIVGADGKFKSSNDIISAIPQIGDIVEKDGKLYQVGADGQLIPYKGKLKPGQIVWKDGKAYIVGADGQLQEVVDCTERTINNKPYIYLKGQWVPLTANGAQPGQFVLGSDQELYKIDPEGNLISSNNMINPDDIIWRGCVPIQITADGKPKDIKDGDEIVDSNGHHYIYKNGKLIDAENAASKEKEEASKNEANQNDSLRDAFKSALIAIKGNKQQDDNTDKKEADTSLDKNILAAQMKALSNPMGPGSEYQTQNDQAGKVAFLNAENDGRTTAKGKWEHPKSKFTLYAGSIINATLQTGINSDLPGEIIARVDKNIYDSVTGNYILIPQGTTVIGTYDSSIAYGQERALIVFTRLIFPNGSSMPLENQPGADLRGFAGLSGTVNNHLLKIFGHALMFSIFSAAGQLSQPSTDNQGGPTDQQIIFAAIGQQFTQTASQMIAKDMNIQPTIEAEPGKGFSILTTRDIVFPSFYNFD